MSDREKRIEEACAAAFTSEGAKDAFRKAAAALPGCSIFWVPEESDRKAMLEDDSVSIEFYDLKP